MNAKIWGDLHFVGADGRKFDVQGEAGKIYHILSDKNLQMNAEFVAWGNSGTTAIGCSDITLEQIKLKSLKMVQLPLTTQNIMIMVFTLMIWSKN